MTVLVSVFTVYSLYGDYVRLLFFKATANPYFDGLTGLTLIVMVIEFILQLSYQRKYIFSFYFWFDIAFPLLLIFDFNFLQSVIYQLMDNTQARYY